MEKTKKFRIPFVFELSLCIALILLFRLTFLWQDLIFSSFGITDLNAFVRFIFIFTHAVSFCVIIGVGLRIQKKTLASVCFFRKVSIKVWGALIVCSIGFVLFKFYINFLFDSFRWGWYTGYGAAVESNHIFYTIDIALIPAVAEEIMFKGLIFTSLKKRHSQITAVIIASLLFAATHLNIYQFIPHFLFSLFTFWVYLRTGSLILPMIIHFINNFFAFVLISEPFAELGTFYASILLFAIGFYLLNKASKPG